MNKIIMITLVAFLAASCSTVKKVNPFDNGMTELDKVKKNEVPEWFLETESSTSEKIVVVATDVSKDMQFAIDKAMMNAKVQIAGKLKTDINSLSKESVLEGGHGVKDTEKQTDRVSKIHTKQSIGFFKRDKLEVFREKNYYRAYVRLVMNLEEARLLTTPRSSETREDKFKELEEKVVVTPVAPINN